MDLFVEMQSSLFSAKDNPLEGNAPRRDTKNNKLRQLPLGVVLAFYFNSFYHNRGKQPLDFRTSDIKGKVWNVLSR